MSRKGKGLGAPASAHRADAQSAIAQARRFLTAPGRNVSCEVRLQHAAHAKVFAEIAVREAASAVPRKHTGPSALQVEASRVADDAIRNFAKTVHTCSRGFPRFKQR